MKHEVLEVNGYKINLPIGLDQTMDTPVRDSYQSFLTESTKDVRRHLTCLTTLLPPTIAGSLDLNVLHAFGGLGASAQVIDQACPKATIRHEFLERDPTCVNYLRSRYNHVAHVQNTFKFLPQMDLNPYDLILLDMSVGTIKTPGVKEMWTHVSNAVKMDPAKVIWFTDTACHKIHLNYKSYAKDFGREVEPTAWDYLNAYSWWLENTHGLTISSAMREAGEFYCVVHSDLINKGRFTEIPYV